MTLSTSITHPDTRMSSRVTARRVRTSFGQCCSGSVRPVNEPLSELLLHSQLARPISSQLIPITYHSNASSYLILQHNPPTDDLNPCHIAFSTKQPSVTATMVTSTAAQFFSTPTTGPLLPGGIRTRPTWSLWVILNRNMESGMSPKIPRRHINDAVEKQVPVQDLTDLPSAYRIRRSELQHARRAEQRELVRLNRRNILVQEDCRPIPSYVNIIDRPGARTFRLRGHVDVTSAAFHDARKRTRKLQERLKSDDAAAQTLYEA